MSAAAAIARLLYAPALSGHVVRSRRGDVATSTPPCFRSCPPRRGYSSSCRRPATPARAAAATGASTDAAGGGDGEGAGGTAVVSSGGAAEDNWTAGEVKAALFQSLQGINRGIFGVQSQKRREIEVLVQLLEARKTTPHPTDHLHQVGGCWKLLYSTVTILGSKRTKLGLRDFVSLDDISQRIDVAQGKAINEIKFSVRGLKMLSGQLTIVASFRVASKTRVDITYESSDITPEQLMNLFQKNYDLLLAIFNPEGWLEITYVDESIRIGRDNKGNIFILERTREEQT